MNRSRFDAPFWGLLLTAVVLVGSLGLLALAAAAQDAAHTGSHASSLVVVEES